MDSRASTAMAISLALVAPARAQASQPALTPRRPEGSRMDTQHGARAIAALALLAPLAASASGPAVRVGDAGGDHWPGERRGQVSIGYQSQYTRGLITDLDSTVGSATTDTHVLNLAIDYALSPRWNLHLSLPFIRKKTGGGPPGSLPPGAHTLAQLPDGVVAEFIDDGAYHGNWQDWQLGASYQAHWAGFDLEPRVLLIVPSNNYPFYGNASTGQRLSKLRLGAGLSRRIGLSEWWYAIGYDFEIWEKVIGKRLNKHYVDAALGYDFDSGWSVRAWSLLRRGQGTDFSETDRTCRCDFWYQHDRINRHEYLIGGLSLHWRLDPSWSVTATAGTMFWGSTVHDLRRLYGLQVARAF